MGTLTLESKATSLGLSTIEEVIHNKLNQQVVLINNEKDDYMRVTHLIRFNGMLTIALIINENFIDYERKINND